MWAEYTMLLAEFDKPELVCKRYSAASNEFALD